MAAQGLGVSMLLMVVGGCAGQSAETQSQLARLNEQLIVLQNDRDRLMERVDALEARTSGASAVSDAVTKQDEVVTRRPPLKVVRLEPNAAGETDDLAASEANEVPDAPATDLRDQPVKAEPDEPKVVLYGEGAQAGARPSREGATSR
jgi:hypothetical protein